MKIIYISGPFTAPTAWRREQNVRTAEAMALEVWRLGAVAVCPHTNTRNFEGELPYEMWIDGDLEIIRRCDAVLLVGDWLTSKGSLAEVKLAQELRLPIFSGEKSLHELRVWLGQVILDDCGEESCS